MTTLPHLIYIYILFVNSLFFFKLQSVIAQFQSKVEVLEEKGLVSKSATKGAETPDSNSEQYKPKHHRFDDENDSDSNQNSQGKYNFDSIY